jgi:hypothetical protein
MGQLFKILSVSLLLWGGLAVQSANAQSANTQGERTGPVINERYPPIDDPWDATSYRALAERVETEGLALPTLADAATKPVFERMVNVDNIPLRMGLNKKLSIGIRYQRLDSAVQPIHRLVALYSNETQKGKPYAQELARLMVYESKVFAAFLELSEPWLATVQTDKRYQVHVAYHDKVKGDARQLYFGLVRGMTETRRYSKSDILRMIEGALDGLSSYQAIFTDQDRQDLVEMLTQQISKTTDRELKTALTDLRDSIKNRRVRT